MASATYATALTKSIARRKFLNRYCFSMQSEPRDQHVSRASPALISLSSSVRINPPTRRQYSLKLPPALLLIVGSRNARVNIVAPLGARWLYLPSNQEDNYAPSHACKNP